MNQPSAKNKLSLKKRMLVVYLAMGFVVVLSLVSVLFKKKDTFTLEEILGKKISAIQINDKGLYGDRRFMVTNPDSIANLMRIFRNSTPVEFQQLHLKIGLASCEIAFKDSSGSFIPVVITDASRNEGILRSGNDYYRNNALLKELAQQLYRPEGK